MITKIENSCGCTIQEENMPKDILENFLKAGWKVVKG